MPLELDGEIVETWTAPDAEDFPLLARRLHPYAHVDEDHWAYKHIVWAGGEIIRLCEAETGWGASNRYEIAEDF